LKKLSQDFLAEISIKNNMTQKIKWGFEKDMAYYLKTFYQEHLSKSKTK